MDELPEHFPLSVSPLQQILIHTVNMEKRETKYCEIVFMRLGAYFHSFCTHVLSQGMGTSLGA